MCREANSKGGSLSSRGKKVENGGKDGDLWKWGNKPAHGHTPSTFVPYGLEGNGYGLKAGRKGISGAPLCHEKKVA